MAEVRIRAASGLRMSVHAEGFEQTEKGLKDARREFNRRLGLVQKVAAEQTVLPAAKSGASRYRIGKQSVRDSLIIRASRGGGVTLTSRLRGPRARGLGLLEFGGTVHGPIYPKGTVLVREDGRTVQVHTKKKALTIGPGGRPIARITTPRVYRARQFLSRAVDRELPAFGEEARDLIVHEFAQEGFTIT